MINEVAYYLYQRGFYLLKNNIPYSDEEREYRFSNKDLPFFEIDIYQDISTSEITRSTLTLYFDFKNMDTLYYKQSFNCLETICKYIRKAIDKFEKEIIIPMCDKFNLNYKEDYFIHDETDYLQEFEKLKKYVEFKNGEAVKNE